MTVTDEGRRLLREATPGPWRSEMKGDQLVLHNLNEDALGLHIAWWDADSWGEMGREGIDFANARVAAYAVSHLPAFLAVVEALQRLANDAARAVTEPRRFHENEDDRQQALGQSIAIARAALASFTEEPTE